MLSLVFSWVESELRLHADTNFMLTLISYLIPPSLLVNVTVMLE